MFRRLLVYYWRESCNIRTVIFLLVVILLTLFSQELLWYNDQGQAKLFRPIEISLIDHDQSIVSQMVRSQLSDIDAIGTIHLDDMEAAQKRLEQNDILMIVELPAGFYAETPSGGQRDNIKIWLNEQMPTESNLFARFLNHAVDSISTVQASLFAYQEALRPLVDKESLFQEYSDAATLNIAFKLIERNKMLVIEKEARMRQVWFVIASLLSLFTMLPSLLVLTLAQHELQSGQHARLLIGNVLWWKLHLSKISIGFIWLITGLIPMWIIASKSMPQVSLSFLGMAILPLYLSSSLVSLALAYRSRQTEAVMLTAWLLILLFMLVGGAIYPKQLLPDWLRFLQPLSPAYWSFTTIYDGLYERTIARSTHVWSWLTVAVCAFLSWLSWKRNRAS